MAPRNVFYNNFESCQEQELLQSLVTESIQIFGEDFIYIPRDVHNLDGIYGTDDISTFTKTFLVEMYVKAKEGFDGSTNFASKFGLQIRDAVTLTVSLEAFANEITTQIPLNKPRSGDLIFFPQNKKCFEIVFVDDKPFFYQLGSLQSYDLYCELFEYSEETFNTGIDEIDSIQKTLSINILDYGFQNENGLALVNEDNSVLVSQNFELPEINPQEDNEQISTEVSEILIFNEANPFSPNGFD